MSKHDWCKNNEANKKHWRKSILLCAHNCIQVAQPTKDITTEMNNLLKYTCVHICATRDACMQYQTCIDIAKHMDTPNDIFHQTWPTFEKNHNRNTSRLPGVEEVSLYLALPLHSSLLLGNPKISYVFAKEPWIAGKKQQTLCWT